MNTLHKFLHWPYAMGALMLLTAGSCKSATLRMRMPEDQKEGDSTTAVAAMSIQQNPQHAPAGGLVVDELTQEMENLAVSSTKESDSKANAPQPASSPLCKAISEYTGDAPAGVIISYLDSSESLLEELKEVNNVEDYEKILQKFTVFAQQGRQLPAPALLQKIAFPVVDNLFGLAEKNLKTIEPTVKATLDALVQLAQKQEGLQYQDINTLVARLDSIQNKEDIESFFSSKGVNWEHCQKILSTMVNHSSNDAAAQHIVFCVIRGFVSILKHADDGSGNPTDEYTLYNPPHDLVKNLKEIYAKNELLGPDLLEISKIVADILKNEIIHNDSSFLHVVSKHLVSFWQKAGVSPDESLRKRAQAMINNCPEILRLAAASSAEAFYKEEKEEEADASPE